MKPRKTHEIINGVLKPTRFFGSKAEAKDQAFHKFIIQATDDEFERAINVIIKDDEIFSSLSQSKLDINNIFETLIYGEQDINGHKAIYLYDAIFSREIDKLAFFNDNKIIIEDLFVKGEYSKVEKLLLDLNDKVGYSIWSINLQFNLYTAKKEYSKIDEFLDNLKSQNDHSIFSDIVRVSGWKLQTVDSKLILESMVRRPNKEFIEGGASNIAAFYSLLCLPSSLYEDVDLLHSINWLQRLPLVDLFDCFCKVIESALIKKSLESNDRTILLRVFKNLESKISSIKISNIISSLEERGFDDSQVKFDQQINDYCEGKYDAVIDYLENDVSSNSNIITKINMYAKSYIYTSRKPAGLPDVLREIINNLISIYSLEDANQSVEQLVDLAIKYSSLELSEHILISIVKSAPYFFSSENKKNIVLKSNFLNCPLTPLSYNLNTPPSMYVKSNSKDLPLHLKVKKDTIESITSSSSTAHELVDQYYNLSPIKKDAIELKVQYLLQIGDIDEIIDFSASELINNPSSNVCIPLEYITTEIENDSIYTIDSVICGYFHNHFSDLDGSALLNEVFEEYFFSLGIERPSELVTKELNSKNIFLLKNISKIDVMDYLGSFDDDNDLKIERINILNKLVSHNYVNQSDIDMECKSIVDDIIIESEAAKFNDSKIYVDTRFIIDKRRSDIESLVLKYHSHNGDNHEDLVTLEDMTILKGNKNETLTRLFKMLLVEYMDNKEIGLDKNLSSEIRHGFFSNLMCSNLQKRQLITELDESGNYKSNDYWKNYYKIVNSSILDEVDGVLIKFSDDFNSLIESAEQWMKTSLNGDEPERIFRFDFTTIDFNKVRSVLDAQGSVDEVINEIFDVFNIKLLKCLEEMKKKLNEDFMFNVDCLFSSLIEDINHCKHGTALSDLFSEIKLANTEVKEDIRTVCEWFSLRKNVEIDSFEIDKSVKLSERCFQQINNIDVNVDIDYEDSLFVEGSHLYALVFTFINCFNNCLKHSFGNSKIDVAIKRFGLSGFLINITNTIDTKSKQALLDGKLSSISKQLVSMNNHELLVNEGGSGLYKSLHGLRMVSDDYTITPSIVGNRFNVEVKYAK
ncbi:hypothetical protein BCS86_00810 [Vibrio splendidus]|nr:hypothetical protein BCS86_00810 [Vibrio splendidus]